MTNLSADSRKKRWRKVGRIGGIAAAVAFVAGGIIFAAVGGMDSTTSGDRYHVWGTRDATELALVQDATATLDASITGDASVTADASP